MSGAWHELTMRSKGQKSSALPHASTGLTVDTTASLF